MTTPATQLKVGVFVIIAVGTVTAAALGLGLCSRAPVVRYHTYLDESVQGLEIEAPVSYRGVRIGAVRQISIAPDLTHVDIGLDIRVRTAERLALDKRAPSLRARLETQGITGVKYIEVEPQGAVPPPAPELGFVPDVHYIAARPSLISMLATEAERISHALPALVDEARTTLEKLGRVIGEFHDEHIAVRVGKVLDRADAVVGDVRHLVGRIDDAGLPARAKAVLDKVDSAMVAARSVIDRLDHVDALIASGRRAVDSLGDLGQGGGELERTIKDLGDAARSFRDLIDELDRDPDMLVKGRARTKKP